MLHQKRTNVITTQYFWLAQSILKRLFRYKQTPTLLYEVLLFIIIPIVCGWRTSVKLFCVRFDFIVSEKCSGIVCYFSDSFSKLIHFVDKPILFIWTLIFQWIEWNCFYSAICLHALVQIQTFKSINAFTKRVWHLPQMEFISTFVFFIEKKYFFRNGFSSIRSIITATICFYHFVHGLIFNVH